MGWEEALWDELDALPEAERIVAMAETITRMSQHLLPLLGRERRTLAVKLIEGKTYSYSSLAESIGSRIGTVQRLVEEGRRLLREERVDA
jgi:DNA-directed RNA polymerase specialized sigma24 family protein